MMLTTQRLTLTHFKPGYAEEFTKALSDPKMNICPRAFPN